jgi:hypothetical protein
MHHGPLKITFTIFFTVKLWIKFNRIWAGQHYAIFGAHWKIFSQMLETHLSTVSKYFFLPFEQKCFSFQGGISKAFCLMIGLKKLTYTI